MFFEMNLGGGDEQYPEPSIQLISTTANKTVTVDLGTLEVGTYHLNFARYHWTSSGAITNRTTITAYTGCTLTALETDGLFELVVSTKGAVTFTTPNTGTSTTANSGRIETVLWRVA